MRNEVYIASPVVNRDEIKQKLVPMIEALGLKVVSRWLDADQTMTNPKTVTNAKWVDRCNRLASMNLEDINRAHVVVFYAKNMDKSSGGTHVELGHCIATGKKTVWIGQDIPNVFCIRAQYFCEIDKNFIKTLCAIYGIDITKVANMSKQQARALDDVPA